MGHTMKTSTANRFLAALALLALLAPSGLAQAPQQPAQPQAPPASQLPARPVLNPKGTIRSAVDLVEVDVQITDRDGKPLKGL
jgi:hypothetical protein